MSAATSPYIVTVLACAGMVMALAAAVAQIVLFISFKRKMCAQQEEIAAYDGIPQKLNELGKEIGQMQLRLDEIERRRTPLADWSPESASVHLNRRGQVLRLHRRGESSVQIASALGLVQGEVKLIIRLHELTRANPETEKTNQRALNAATMFDTGYTGPPTGGKRK